MNTSEETTGALLQLGATPLLKNGKATPYGVIERATPDTARELLKLMPERQRRVSKEQVARIANAHANGKFVFTGEAIKFTKNLEGVDGQHRLEGMIKADVTMDLTICIVPDEAFYVIDATGVARSLMQIAKLAMDRCIHSSVIAALVMEHDDFPTGKSLISKDEKIRLVAQHRWLERAVVLHDTGTGKKTTSGLLAGAVRCLDKNETKAMEFFGAAFKNEHEVNGVRSTAAKALATWMYTRSRAELNVSSSVLAAREEAAKAIHAYNAYARGQDLNILKGCVNGVMPVVAGG